MSLPASMMMTASVILMEMVGCAGTGLGMSPSEQVNTHYWFILHTKNSIFKQFRNYTFIYKNKTIIIRFYTYILIKHQMEIFIYKGVYFSHLIMPNRHDWRQHFTQTVYTCCSFILEILLFCCLLVWWCCGNVLFVCIYTFIQWILTYLSRF